MNEGNIMRSSSAVERSAVNRLVAGSSPASAAKPARRLRILTNRNYEVGYEAIEWDAEHQQLFWFAEEGNVVACFPCDLTFASEKFAECGRELDVTKLPNWPKSASPSFFKALILAVRSNPLVTRVWGWAHRLWSALTDENAASIKDD